VVPENAEVANAIGAAASSVTVEQQVRIHPQRGSDGIIMGYQVRSNEESALCEELESALETARTMARTQAFAEARRRGAEGELDCVLDEERCVYGATGVMEIVREWVITARVG